MTLREAAQRTSRSITTLRRYVRGGRLKAEKRPGRFGPEYFVSENDLALAGLEPTSPVRPRELARRDSTSLERDEVDPRGVGRPFDQSVPLSLYQELQMKHEQLLVQYGMVRASGARLLELRAELEARHRELESVRSEVDRLNRERVHEAANVERELRQAELEREGGALEIAALEEKVRALEMLTRNARTSDNVERQFRQVMEQSQRVERLTSLSREKEAPRAPWTGKPADTDH